MELRSSVKQWIMAVSLAMLCLMTGCDDPDPYPGYTALDTPGLYYQVRYFDEEGLAPQHGDMLRFTMGLAQADTVSWQQEQLQVIRYDTLAQGLKGELNRFHAGDSISIIMEPQAYALEFNRKLVDGLQHADVRLKIHTIIPEKQWLGNKAMDIKVKSRMEQEVIQFLLTQAEEAGRGYELKNDMYVHYIAHGDEGRFTAQEDLLLLYTATLPDGRIIDERATAEEGLFYKIGMQGQIIPGLAQVIRAMDRADHLQVIIPSRLAFGEQGSAGEVVPPWTPVLYDLRVVVAGAS